MASLRPKLLYALIFFVAVALTDAADPGSFGFKQLASWPANTRGTPTDIVVIDTTAYIAMGEGGLCMVDVTSRTAPKILSRLDLPGNATRIKVDGNYAYLSCGSGGLQIVNIANPAAPALAGTFIADGPVVKTAVSNPYAYVADGANKVTVLEVSNPAAGVVISKLSFPTTVYDVEAERVIKVDTNNVPTGTNWFLQVANGTNGFLPYGFTKLLSVGQEPQLIFQEVAEAWDARSMCVVGHYVLWTDRGFITRYDFLRRDPGGEVMWFTNFTASLPITKVAASSQIGTPVDHGTVYMFNGSASYIGGWKGSSTAFRRPNSETGMADPNDGYLYYLDTTAGLTIYQSSSGAFVSATPIAGEANWIRVEGDRVYVADLPNGVQILNVANDGTLTHRSSYFNGSARSFDVAKSNLFVMASTNIDIVDVSNATQPTLITNIATLVSNRPPTFVGDIAINNDIAYIGASLIGLAAVDVSNPAKPALLKKSNLFNRTPFAMAFSGTNIFAAERLGLMSIGLAPDQSATVLQTVTTGQAERGVAVSGTTAFFCDRANGLKIYDVTDPANMVLLSTYDTPGSAYAVAVSGSFAYVADQQDGILVLNISNPSDPKLVASLALENSVFDLQVRSNRMFLAHGSEGVTVWDLIPKAAQTIDFPPIADKSIRDLPFTLNATASSGLPVEYTVISGPATVQNGRVTLTGTGNVTIRAAQAGNDQIASVYVDRTFAVSKAAQTINFPEITDKTTRSAPFEITAISDSGLPVSIYVLAGPATIDGGLAKNLAVVTTIGAGAVTIRATNPGNSDFLPAVVERTFSVIEVPRDPQTILIPDFGDLSIEDDPFVLEPSASSGLPVEVSVRGVATLDFGVLSLIGLGTVTIDVTQAGDRDYLPVSFQKTFEVRDLAGAATANVLAHNPTLPADATSPNADPDHDGLPNIVEYILRTDPTSATSMEGHPTAEIYESAGAKYLKIHYLKPRTTRYAVGLQVTDFADYPFNTWLSLPAGFNDDGTGEFLWPLAQYRRPLLRFVLRYP